MASNNYNNAVFTFLPPQELPDPRLKWRKKMRMTTTANNKDRKCLVIVKDLTDYKNRNYWDLTKSERAKFTIDDFEKEDLYPLIEIEDFSEFLEHLPKSFFEKGLAKKETLDVFADFDQFLDGKMKAGEYYLIGDEDTPAFKAGFLEAAPAPTAEEAEKLWENVPLELLKPKKPPSNDCSRPIYPSSSPVHSHPRL